MSRAHVGAGGHIWLAGLALVVSGACGPKAAPRQPGQEWLESIEIEGNTSIETKELRDGLALRRVQNQGASPDPYVIVVDGKRIEGTYIRRGYLEVDVRSRVERNGHATKVIYTVTEGPRANTRVLITGIPATDPDLTVSMVRDTLPIKDGEPFEYERYDEAKERMLGIIQDAGYARAKLEAHVIVDRANHEAVVHLDYKIGPKCRFGDIEILGLDGEVAEAVRARASIKPGELYSPAAVVETQRAIYDMRRFSMVHVQPDNRDDDVVNVRISVARAARNELVTGGGVGLDPATYEVRGRTGYSRIGFPFPLTDFSIDLRPAYALLRDGSGNEPRVRATATLRRIDLFRPFVVGEVEAGYNYLIVEGWTSYGPRGQLGLESPLFTRKLHGRVGWRIEHLDFRNISPLIDDTLRMGLGVDRSQRIGQYSQTLALDLRDDPIEPALGVYAELRVDEGTELAGGTSRFFRVTPELRGYLPVAELPATLAARARAGRIYGDVPVTERYFSGGSTTQRGFTERRLAPSIVGEVDGDRRVVPYGGAELFESNIELRSRVGTIKNMGVGGIVFLDGADVVTQDDSLDLGNLHWAAGVGLRLFTVVGAVRADVGYRLNRTGPMDPNPGSKFALHLSIGEAF